MTALAQAGRTVVSGRVSDSQGHPLAGAHISIVGQGALAASDGEGRFSLSLPPGEYQLEASILGFKSSRLNVRVSSKALSVAFTLQEDYTLLDQVVVVAPSKGRELQQKPFSATALDVKPIVSSLGSLNQLVSRASGVRLREEGGVGSTFDLTINGLSGNAIRYFINGVPLSSMGDGITLSNLPVNIVDHIEIYKGVVPPELGLDALGGAVNIITNKNHRNFLDCSISGGSFHTGSLDLSGQYRDRHSGLTLRPTLGLEYSHNDYIMRDVQVWNEEKYEFEQRDMRRFHDKYKSLVGQLQIGITDRPWADEALIGASYALSESELQTGHRQSLVIGEAVRDRSAFNVSASYSKRNLLIDGLSADLHLSFAKSHLILTDTACQKYSWDGSSRPSGYNELTHRAPAIRHTLRPTWSARANIAYATPRLGSLNFNYLLTSTDNERYDTFDPYFEHSKDRMSRHIFGLSLGRHFSEGRLHTSIFVKDYLYHVEIGQQDLYWITGSTAEEPQVTRNKWGYGLGVRYALCEPFSLKGSFERATRLPSARELLGNGLNIYPNFKLKPEQAYNLNVAFYGQTTFAELHHLNYEVTLFYRDISNYIHRVVKNDVESLYENIGASRVIGSEVELKYNYHHIVDLALNGTYSDERDRQRTTLVGKTNPTFGYRVPNKPWIYSNALLGVNWQSPFGLEQHNIRFNVSLGYIHWFYLTWGAFGAKESKAVIPSQYDLGGGITWSFANNKYSLSIQGSNLLDQPLYDNYMLQKPSRAFFCKLRIFIN